MSSPDMVQNKAAKLEERYLSHSSSKLESAAKAASTIVVGGDFVPRVPV